MDPPVGSLCLNSLSCKGKDPHFSSSCCLLLLLLLQEIFFFFSIFLLWPMLREAEPSAILCCEKIIQASISLSETLFQGGKIITITSPSFLPGSPECWSPYQLCEGEGEVTPWTSRLLITGPHRETKHHSQSWLELPNQPPVHVIGLWEEADKPTIRPLGCIDHNDSHWWSVSTELRMRNSPFPLVVLKLLYCVSKQILQRAVKRQTVFLVHVEGERTCQHHCARSKGENMCN